MQVFSVISLPPFRVEITERVLRYFSSTLGAGIQDCAGQVSFAPMLQNPFKCYTKIMEAYYSDTDPQIEALQISLLRQAPTWRKMEMLINLNASARELALTGLSRRYPNASEKVLQRRLADLLLGEELVAKVYGNRIEDAV